MNSNIEKIRFKSVGEEEELGASATLSGYCLPSTCLAMEFISVWFLVFDLLLYVPEALIFAFVALMLQSKLTFNFWLILVPWAFSTTIGSFIMPVVYMFQEYMRRYRNKRAHEKVEYLPNILACIACFSLLLLKLAVVYTNTQFYNNLLRAVDSKKILLYFDPKTIVVDDFIFPRSYYISHVVLFSVLLFVSSGMFIFAFISPSKEAGANVTLYFLDNIALYSYCLTLCVVSRRKEVVFFNLFFEYLPWLLSGLSVAHSLLYLRRFYFDSGRICSYKSYEDTFYKPISKSKLRERNENDSSDTEPEDTESTEVTDNHTEWKPKHNVLTIVDICSQFFVASLAVIIVVFQLKNLEISITFLCFVYGFERVFNMLFNVATICINAHNRE